MLIREEVIVPNSFQSLHSSQKRASSGRDGFIEITLTDSHLLSFLRRLAPEAQSGRHEPSRRSCASSFNRTSQFVTRRVDDAPGEFGLSGEMLIPGSRHTLRTGRKTRARRGRMFKFTSNLLQTGRYPKHLEKMRKASWPLELRRKLPSKDCEVAKKGEVGR